MTGSGKPSPAALTTVPTATLARANFPATVKELLAQGSLTGASKVCLQEPGRLAALSLAQITTVLLQASSGLVLWANLIES